MSVPALWQPLYPFPSRFAQVNGFRCHYLDEGQGEPLLLLHGNPTWSFYYRDLIRGLRDRYRLIAPDHIGCGLSEKPDDARYPYRLERRVEDIDALVRQLDLPEKLTLVLHDWGGMIGLAWASRHPQRVGRLVLLNTAAFGLPAGKRLPWQLALVRNTPLGALLVRGCNAFSAGLVRFCTVRPLSTAVRAGYLYPYRTWSDRRAVLRFVQDIPLRPSDPGFDLVQSVDAGLARFAEVPTFIGWGARDFVFDDAFLEGWRKRMPHAEVHRFAEAGHLVLDDAGEQLLPLIRDFLARHPLPGGANA
jgi:pimeloyl-ACP methyl ester carboxylesterase